MDSNEITINGIVHVPKDSIKGIIAKPRDGMKYCIVRTYSAGVFAGYLEKKEGKEVVVRDARRIWSWAGAATLSQLSIDGTADPGNCKFPEAVNSVILTEAVEIIECTEVARLSIKGVKIWKK